MSDIVLRFEESETDGVDVYLKHDTLPYFPINLPSDHSNDTAYMKQVRGLVSEMTPKPLSVVKSENEAAMKADHDGWVASQVEQINTELLNLGSEITVQHPEQFEGAKAWIEITNKTKLAQIFEENEGA